MDLQGAALVAVTNVYEWLDDTSIRKSVLPKIRIVFDKNSNDLKIINNVLECIERVFAKLDKSQVFIESLVQDAIVICVGPCRLLTRCYRCCGKCE